MYFIIVQESLQVSRKPLRKAVLTAMRKKLRHFVDDRYMVLEWAVAAFLDPRAKELLVGPNSSFCLNMFSALFL